MKKAIPLLLALILAFSILVPSALAVTDEDMVIQPRYARIATVDVDFDINSSGKSTCYSKVTTADWSDNIDLTMELQRLEGKDWTTIKTWNTSGTHIVSLDKTWYVVSGYDFRLKITSKITDSNGVWRETATDYSYTVTY